MRRYTHTVHKRSGLEVCRDVGSRALEPCSLSICGINTLTHTHTGTPGIHDRRWPCGASSGGHGERRPTPLGRGAHRQRSGADDSGHWPRDRAECGPTSEEGWTQPPPPPPSCQEDALPTAGRCQARKSRDRGDITPKPQRFWLR